MNFKRGQNPHKKLNLGKYKLFEEGDRIQITCDLYYVYMSSGIYTKSGPGSDLSMRANKLRFQRGDILVLDNEAQFCKLPNIPGQYFIQKDWVLANINNGYFNRI